MKTAIGNNLSEGIVEQDTVPGKPAADHHIISLHCGVEEISHIGQEVLKVTVHGQDVPACRQTIPVAQRKTYSIGHGSGEKANPGILFRQMPDDRCRFILAVVIDENNFGKIIIIETPQAFYERDHVHFFVVAGNDN